MARRRDKIGADTTTGKLGILERYNTTFVYANMAVFIFLAAQYLYYWVNPSIGDAELIRNLFWLFLFEVFAVHSAPFMAVMPWWMLFVVVPFYGIFVYALNVAMGSDYIIITYLVLMLSRIRYVFGTVRNAIKWRTAIQSFCLTWGYLIVFGMVGCSSDIVPRLGFDESFLGSRYLGERLDAGETVSEQCFWPDFVEPHILFCAAILYYILAAYLEYRFSKWMPRDR